MSNTLIEKQSLENKVKQWIRDRNIHAQDPLVQIAKLYEEVNELHQAMIKEDETEIIDALGDIQVVLTSISLQLDIELSKTLEVAYNVIKERKGKMINGTFVKLEDLKNE